jgi:hypothetical protein
MDAGADCGAFFDSHVSPIRPPKRKRRDERVRSTAGTETASRRGAMNPFRRYKIMRKDSHPLRFRYTRFLRLGEMLVSF